MCERHLLKYRLDDKGDVTGEYGDSLKRNNCSLNKSRFPLKLDSGCGNGVLGVELMECFSWGGHEMEMEY